MRRLATLKTLRLRMVDVGCGGGGGGGSAGTEAAGAVSVRTLPGTGTDAGEQVRSPSVELVAVPAAAAAAAGASGASGASTPMPEPSDGKKPKSANSCGMWNVHTHTEQSLVGPKLPIDGATVYGIQYTVYSIH